MSTAERLAKNTLMILCAKAIQFLTGFLLLILIPRYLGPTLFGDYSFIKVFVSFVVSCSYFGLQEILIREVSKDKSKANLYLGSILFLRSLVNIIVIFLIFSIERILNFSSLYIPAIYLSAIAEFLLSFSLIIIAVFRAFEKMHYEASMQFFTSLFSLTFISLVIYFDRGFTWLFVIFAAANFIQLLLSIKLCGKLFIKPRFEIDSRLSRYFMREGLFIGLAILFLNAAMRIDVIILKAFRSPEEISFFHIPHNLIMQISWLPVALSAALFPILSRLSAPTESHNILSVYEKILKLFFVFTLPLSVIVTILGTDLIGYFIGTDFLPAAVSLQIIIWAINFLFPDILAHHVLTAMGKQKFSMVSAIICFFFKLFFNLLLIPKYGYIGASVATLFSYFLLFLISYHYIRMFVGRVDLFNLLHKIVYCAFIFWIVIVLLKALNFNWFLILFFSLIVYLYSLSFFNIFTPREAGMIKEVIKFRRNNLNRGPE